MLRIRAANDFQSGLSEIRREPADLVVLDLLLDGDSGLDLLKHVRGLAPNARIVVVTGQPSVETAVAAVRLGARSYLAKPFDALTLLGAFFGEVDAGPVAEHGEATLPIERSDNVVSIQPTDPRSFDRWTRDRLEEVLAECGGNLTHAAERLGMHRRTLQRRLAKAPPPK